MSTVAVIVSTYNSHEYLAKVLEGYLNQSRRPDELIVADDGSDQRTAQTVTKFASEADFPIRFVWQEDEGYRLAKIRNEAVKTSCAEYLIFVDGDCIPERRFIEDHIRTMKPGYFLQGKRLLVSRRASASFNHPGLRALSKMCLKGNLSGCHHLLRIPGLTIVKRGLRGIKGCHLALYRRDFLAVNGFNEDFVGWGREDSELAVRLFKYGLTRKDVPFSAILFHLWHEENVNESIARNEAILAEAIKSPSFYCENGLYKETRKS